mmetsp:Transcript_30871/g.91656  ORF Transcript_30871/g.91656 Transcript_30871/m.91656 type:complete len:230 (-) Transcript_30871:1172-1861(-)
MDAQLHALLAKPCLNVLLERDCLRGTIVHVRVELHVDHRELVVFLEQELGERLLQEGLRQRVCTLPDHLRVWVDLPVQLLPQGQRGLFHQPVHVFPSQARGRVDAHPAAEAVVGLWGFDLPASRLHQGSHLVEFQRAPLLAVVGVEDEVAARPELHGRHALDRLAPRHHLCLLLLVRQLCDRHRELGALRRAERRLAAHLRGRRGRLHAHSWHRGSCSGSRLLHCRRLA